jgi:hypothetical protein
MTMPGFTADVSAGRTKGHYRVTRGWPHGVRDAVAAQLGGRVFGGGRFGGRFGTLEDYWVCADACYRAYSACLDTCEGTLGAPMGSSNCLICDDNYRSCLSGCSRDIA